MVMETVKPDASACYCCERAAVAPRSPPAALTPRHPQPSAAVPTPASVGGGGGGGHLCLLYSVRDLAELIHREATLTECNPQPTPWNSPTGVGAAAGFVPPSRGRCRLLRMQPPCGAIGSRRRHRLALRRHSAAPYVAVAVRDVAVRDVAAPSAATLAVATDSGHRSNGSSPEKPTGARDPAAAPAGVARSRSLDDIDFAQLRLGIESSDLLVRPPQDVDSIAHNFTQLHVGE